MWIFHRVKCIQTMQTEWQTMHTLIRLLLDAPLGAVISGSTLFAQTCQSKNLGSLRYLWFSTKKHTYEWISRGSAYSSQGMEKFC